MAEYPDTSRGVFELPRYGKLKIAETVMFSPEIAKQFLVESVIETIAKMGSNNPCLECPVMLDLIRMLSFREGLEPEDMGTVVIDCAPEEDRYRVVAKMTGGRVQETALAECRLIPWMDKHHR